MHEMPGRRRRRIAAAEQADLVAHAAGAEFRHPQARIHGLRENDRTMETAHSLDRNANGFAAVEVYPDIAALRDAYPGFTVAAIVARRG